VVQNLDDLAQRFNIPGVLQVTTGHGGLPCLQIQSAAAAGQIYLQGAHVTHWQPQGQQPVLFMSGKSQFAAGKPIRGGVPVCFPWFGAKAGDPTAPPHGFARLLEWQLESTHLHPDGAVEVVLALTTNDLTRPAWPGEATIRNRIVMGAALEMTLEIENRGASAARFEDLQHTYLAVGDIRQVRVQGLEGVTYIDRLDAATRKRQEGVIHFTAETDRIYLDTQVDCVVIDPVKKRTIRVAKKNSNTTVVWNPWIAKAKAMPDFGDDEWPDMLCIETSNVGDHAIMLPAGQSHRMSTRLTVETC